MKKLTTLAIFVFLAGLAACSPNQSILQSNIDNTAPTPVPTETIPPIKKITVGELMNRTANAPEDAFTFPCTLHVYKSENRNNLRKLRDTWLSKEKDEQYLLRPSGDCVCPGACVLRVEDITKPGPNNWGLIVIPLPDAGDTAAMDYQWIAKNLDLGSAKLTWASSTPYMNFTDANGVETKTCSIETGAKQKQYAYKCAAVNGKKP